MSTITGLQAVEATRLALAGRKLDEIVAALGLSPGRRVSVWRAIRKFSDAQKRIAAARLTGNFEILSVEEAAAAVAADWIPGPKNE